MTIWKKGTPPYKWAMKHKKLKTLKDFEGRITSADMHRFYNEIKKEAIKWVKSLNYETTVDVPIKCWIKKFFNITEEDLK